MKTRSGRVYRALSYVGRNVAAPFAYATARRIIQNAQGRLAGRVVKPRSTLTPSVVSVQHDVSRRYRRKSMPRRKRQKWVRFTRKVSHSIMQQQPLQTYTNDIVGVQKTFAVNKQVTDGQLIGVVNSGNNDELFSLFKGAYGSALARTQIDKYKIFLKSMCLDMQVTNTGSAGLVLDVYQIIARKDNSDTNRVDIQYSNAFNEQAALSGGAVDPLNPATTPFQNSPFLSFWKIESKKEILLGVGQTTTLQIRIPYNRYLSGKRLETTNIIGGFTRGFLLQARGVPENNAGTGQLAAGNFTWMAQITCAYGVPPGSTTTDATNQA